MGRMTASTDLDETVALLERTPGVVRELLSGLPGSWLGAPDAPDGWTPREVVGHLISAELHDWMPRVEMILRDGTSKPFAPFDRFAYVERDRGVPSLALVERFAQLRAENLARLRELVGDAPDLEQRGLHPDLGQVTLGELIATWAVHDLDHLSQVLAGLAGSHEAAVGSWKAYLGILTRRDGFPAN